jgi:Rrf2 family nitric oxide-sensitive transcriptional repressor
LQLARPASRVTLGDIVREMEASQALVECFSRDGGNCVLTPRCRVKGRLAAARRAFLAELDKTALADCAVAAPRRAWAGARPGRIT